MGQYHTHIEPIRCEHSQILRETEGTSTHPKCRKGTPWWGFQRFPRNCQSLLKPKAQVKQFAISGRIGRLLLAEGQIMAPGILCPDMTPSSRKNWLLAQICTGAPRRQSGQACSPVCLVLWKLAHICSSAPRA